MKKFDLLVDSVSQNHIKFVSNVSYTRTYILEYLRELLSSLSAIKHELNCHEKMYGGWVDVKASKPDKYSWCLIEYDTKNGRSRISAALFDGERFVIDRIKFNNGVIEKAHIITVNKWIYIPVEFIKT